MTNLVPADEIEQIVGIKRHTTRHYARANSEAEFIEGTSIMRAAQTVYILHSERCRESGRDLRECPFSLALNNGIDDRDWQGHEDEAVRVSINRDRRLIPVVPGMRFAP